MELRDLCLSQQDKNEKIKIGSETNFGIVKFITGSGNFVFDKEVVGFYRPVMEIDNIFYFIK